MKDETQNFFFFLMVLRRKKKILIYFKEFPLIQLTFYDVMS